jgi:hypothetical protein
MERPTAMSTIIGSFGFAPPKRPLDLDEEEEEDEYGENSCPSGCCDHDCECDDCLRCANNGLEEPDDNKYEYSAA